MAMMHRKLTSLMENPRKPHTLDALEAKEISDRKKLRRLRLGSMELYTDVMRHITVITDGGSCELNYITYNNYSALPSLACSLDDDISDMCIKEVQFILKAIGYTVIRMSKYKIKVKW